MAGNGTTINKDKDEYLNANFVDGFRRSRAYIATQGPMQSTQNLFWRMVYEQEVKIIVMITHLFEGGKVSEEIWKFFSLERDSRITNVRLSVCQKSKPLRPQISGYFISDILYLYLAMVPIGQNVYQLLCLLAIVPISHHAYLQSDLL